MNKRIKTIGIIVLMLTVMFAISGCDLFTGFESPSNVVVSKLSDSSIHITWDKVRDADYYEIAYRTNMDSESTRRLLVSPIYITAYTHYHPHYSATEINTHYYYVRAWKNGYYDSSYTYHKAQSTGYASPVSVSIR